jgi:hypothetical protein
MSTACKVATLVFSIIFFPIGIISVICFGIKLATCPCIWERRKVKTIPGETWRAIDEFKDNCQKGNVDTAVQALRLHPQLRYRSDTNGVLFTAINTRINNNASWVTVQEPLSKLKVVDAIKLISHAVKIKIQQNIDNLRILISAADILEFVRNSLEFLDLENLENCFKSLFSNVLKIGRDENPLYAAIKMDLADNLLQNLLNFKTRYARTELERKILKLNQDKLMNSIFEQPYGPLHMLLRKAKDKQRLHADVHELRQAHRLLAHTLDQLKDLSKNAGLSQIEKLEEVRTKLKDFCFDFPSLRTFEMPNNRAFLNDRAYLDAVPVFLNKIIDYIDALWQNPSEQQLLELLEDIDVKFDELTTEWKLVQEKLKNPLKTIDDIAYRLETSKITELTKACIQVKKTLTEIMLNES